MFLKTLTLTSLGRIVREIKFHKGINLIVDETPVIDGKETGNNVGKTTVLMLVDFCLGANSKGIYKDPENKSVEYKLVRDYLIEKKIIVQLILKEDLDDPNSLEFTVERNFLSRKERIQRIDSEDKTDEAFDEALTALLKPGHYPQKPTFRQLISHNVRYKDLAITQTLKTLDDFTREDEYETLYLFMFGCQNEQGDKKQDLRVKLRLENTFKTRLEKDETLSGYETALAILDNDIRILEDRKQLFNLNPDFSQNLDKLNQVRYQINLASGQISKLDIRKQLIEEAKSDLQKGEAKIDVSQLQLIYQQATALINPVQKSFEDLLQFHNQMLGEKVRYISQDLPRIDSEIKRQKLELDTLLNEEEHLASEIAKGDSFAELETMINALNDKYRKKGEYENTITQLKSVNANIATYSRELNEIDNELFSESTEKTIKTQLDKFNLIFAKISQELYGEKYAIKLEPKTDKSGKRIYSFISMNVNFSSGKKQGEISCFDFAYTIFADQEGIPCMHFLLNDKKELMHDNQLVKIANLAKQRGIQFVASILRDKLPPSLDSEENIILKLSQSDKLFRIESASLQQ